ncbi:MAG: outer membrane lipoprotein-sorting protein [Boseongicola sp. SB0670_bin_30]|nr:outer membrane lipoprotein-sorting protein [Boseongicola sp. SB0670_bin_30]
MRKIALVLIACMFLPLPAAQAADDQALNIMRRVDAVDDGDNRTARMSMTLIDRDGSTRTRQLQTFMKDRGQDTLNLMFFLSPSNVRNTGFLTHDFRDPDRDDDQWLYLPELRKTKRIAGSSKSQSFMGTDLSYADMTRRVTDEWNYRLLGERDVRGVAAWLIEATPASAAVSERYGYAKSVMFVRKDIDVVVRAVHWLTKGGELKYLDVTGLERIDGVWTRVELEMRTVRNEKTQHRTVLRFEGVRYNQDLDEDLFTLRQLERGP